MNHTQAQAIFDLFEELKKEIIERIPKTVESEINSWSKRKDTYTFDHLDFENMRIVYSRYIGCGEHENHYEPLNLENIFWE